MLTDIFKVLSDPTRLRIMHLLFHHDLCVCELTEIMQESQPKISKHIAIIRKSKLVHTKRREQYIYYSLDRDNAVMLDLMQIAFWGEDAILQEDLKRLQSIEHFVCNR